MGQLIICKRVDFLLNHFSLTVLKFGYVNSEATIILKSWRYCAPENKNEIFQRKTQYYYLKKEELEEKERDFKKILG